MSSTDGSRDKLLAAFERATKRREEVDRKETASPTKTLDNIQNSLDNVSSLESLVDSNSQPPALASTPSREAQLPIWPEPTRGVPNVALRSALFGAIRPGKREYLEKREIAAQGNQAIRYTGARLDQGDLDVWQAVLHLMRKQNLGSDVQLTAAQILREMKKTDTGKNRQTLNRRLTRLGANMLELEVNGRSYEGSLIDDVYQHKEERWYLIRLNPRLVVLFDEDQFTQIDWDIRNALEGKPLAQWLHGYYSSHAAPYPVKTETLHSLSGSDTTSIYRFRQNLKAAMQLLATTSTELGQPMTFSVEDNKVYVEKTPTPSQRRHLHKKKATKAIR